MMNRGIEMKIVRLHSAQGARSKARVLIYLALVLGAVVMLFPFLWMLLTSMKTPSEAMQIPPTFFPANLSWEKYRDVFTALPFGRLYFNTAALIFWRITCALVFSSMAAYAFAKIRFPGSNLLFAIVISQQMLPAQLFIIPQYEMLSKLHMLNTIFALVFPGLVSAFGTFFLRQAYMGIPNELMEAAKLDGCNQFQTFWKIMMPLTKTSMIALALFTAIIAYSDLMWPLICNTDLNMMTLSSGLSTLQGQYATDFPRLMAGSVLAMAPMLALYLFFQKYFVEGIALTGGK